MKSKESELRLTKGGKAAAIKERAIEELRRFVLLFLYLWVLFGLFILDKTVVSRQQGLNFLPHGFALINALVLAKVMLVSESLDLARWMRGKPAIWTIIYESALCSVLFICVHIIEEWAVGMFRGAGIAAGTPAIGGGGWLGLLVVALILFVSLLPFFAFKNVTRAIGARRMKEVLFRSPRFHTEQE
ncbi:hypothetical protein G5V57_17665 [Nordella sp. HKS 07]|uniref:hypothetical protein n=1 Tax=Nordella sp. HKS 07 TaxID=2712222 RepID=UPI0013E1927E|nr:hypothetical protein [Nordella sp. HKS 07]QIG49385.1 hypothetical protein G5V57_17665 [Nordella sp. HKS 07]